MAATEVQTKEQQLQGEFSTAEVTHLIESINMEGDRYLRNHLAMNLAGVEGPIRDYHDNVTRPNLERLVGVAEEMGIPLPFTKPLEERENEVKAKLKNANVEGTLTEGEVVRSAVIDAKAMATWYTVSFNLANHAKVRDVFRRNLETTADQKVKLVDSFRKTKEFVAPPICQGMRLEGALAQGVKPSEMRRGS